MSLAAAIKIANRLRQTRAGRISMRTGRGLANHTAGGLAKRGCQKSISKAYERMDDWEKWAFDQAVELSVRIASDILDQSVQRHISDDEIDSAAERAAISLKDAIGNGIEARIWSLGYDWFFGGIDRDGRIVVYMDVLKQAVLGGIGEIIDDESMTT